jgi:hypothetical protein
MTYVHGILFSPISRKRLAMRAQHTEDLGAILGGGGEGRAEAWAAMVL